MSLPDNIISLSVDDRDLDIFENQYPVPAGMAYNSYLILDDKIALMDTTDERTVEQWKSMLSSALAGRQPDYLIVQHMEPDHSSQIAWLLERYPDMTLVATPKALAMLPQFFPDINLDGRTMAATDGATLSLGATELRFIHAPMIHWPEVMVTFDSTHGVLFSADAFGRFGASNQPGPWVDEARRYYFNIVGKFGAPVRTLLKKASALPIKVIAPLHGPVLTDSVASAVELYSRWSNYEADEKGVLVAYASVYGGTARCAEVLAAMIEATPGAGRVVTVDLAHTDISEAVSQAFRLSGMVVAAVSYDGGVFPTMQSFLERLAAKGYQNRRVGIVENGSWAPSAARAMKALIEPMKAIRLVEPVVTISSRMTEADRPALQQLAEAMAR